MIYKSSADLNQCNLRINIYRVRKKITVIHNFRSQLISDLIVFDEMYLIKVFWL